MSLILLALGLLLVALAHFFSERSALAMRVGAAVCAGVVLVLVLVPGLR